MNNAKSIEEDK